MALNDDPETTVHALYKEMLSVTGYQKCGNRQESWRQGALKI